MSYRLFVDESGSSNIIPSRRPDFFAFAGVIMHDNESENFKITADRIKFKYWSEITPKKGLDVVFRSHEIHIKSGPFTILTDINTCELFHKDLYQFLQNNGLKLIIVVVDKSRASSLGWNAQAVFGKASESMILTFIEFLQKKDHFGQIIIESSDIRHDTTFFRKYLKYVSGGVPALSLSHVDIKNMLTSLSFVSKNNNDIESQVADLFAYPSIHQCLVDLGTTSFIPDSHEEKMCQIIQNKLIKFPLGRRSFIKIP
ncbi:MAG TPA: DUF3800 domain-containing protein [Candidatus Paceibacterota bacterium]|nr:DUF3800 domain-containing protein [Candidatus Paceibacterota bacterium]